MEIAVNYVAILLASVASHIIGSIWYSEIAFGKAWMELVGLDEEKIKEKMMSAVLGMFVLSLVMGYVLSHVMYLSMMVFEYSSQVAGITSAFMMWLGFILPTLAGTGLFEQRSKKLLLLNLSNWLITLLAMGAILGYFGI